MNNKYNSTVLIILQFLGDIDFSLLFPAFPIAY